MNNSSTGNSPDNNSKKNRFTLRRILRAISCVIAAAGLLMITRSIVNAAFLSNYEQENYSRFPEITLLPFRFGENYIVPFNMGNIEYQQGNYDEAASYYRQALDHFGLRAEESLFIDDSPNNVEAAVRAGIGGVVFHADAALLRAELRTRGVRGG